MNYRALHDRIIEAARSRPAPLGYVERHHIVPKSMGGTKMPDNMVTLTGREHYLVHWLLYKIHRTQAMAFAWHNMSVRGRFEGRYTSSSFVYARRAKALFSTGARNHLFGKPLSVEHRAKLRLAKLGKTYEELGRQKKPLGPPSAETRRLISLAGIGRKHSDETKLLVSMAKRGALNPSFGKQYTAEERAHLAERTRDYRARLRALKKETA